MSGRSEVQRMIVVCCVPMRCSAKSTIWPHAVFLGLLGVVACSGRKAPRQPASPVSASRSNVGIAGQPSQPSVEALPPAGSAGIRPIDTTGTKPSTAPSPLVELPGGVFEIGSNSHTDYTRPAHKVAIAPFAIERTEVTVAQYGSCVSAGACTSAARTTESFSDSREFIQRAALLSRGCNGHTVGLDPHPITCVDWNQALAYCTWLGRRLPTEEEWEYAAREPDGRFWVWGANEDPRLANTRDASFDIALGEVPAKGDHNDAFAFTAPVGSFPSDVSVHGVQDLMGNVSEWTASAARPYVNAGGDPQRRIVRGNSWISFGVPGGGIGRYDTDLRLHSGAIGFRCATGFNPPDSHIEPSGTAPKGQCETDAECSNGQGCWKYRCLPCRQVCKNKLDEAMREIAAEPNFCEPHDGICEQTRAEVMAGNRFMARAGYDQCVTSECGKKNE
jgi:formylglycine-generating enzyme required for sulfatase activity